MKVQHAISITILPIIMVMKCPLDTFAQAKGSLTIKSLNYFCEVVVGNTEILKNAHIRFAKRVEETPSDIYDLAYALGEINVLKGNIPNSALLDSLKKSYSGKINRHTEDISGFKPCINPKSRVKYGMKVYQDIFYKGYDFVEIVLFNRKMGDEEMIFIKFDQGTPVGFYLKGLVFD